MQTFNIKNNCFIQAFNHISNNRYVKSATQSRVVKTLTLGISLVAKHARNFGEKTVFWILKCFGLSKKVDDTTQTLSANQPLKPSRTLKQCQHLVFNGEKQMELPIDIARIILRKQKSIGTIWR